MPYCDVFKVDIVCIMFKYSNPGELQLCNELNSLHNCNAPGLG